MNKILEVILKNVFNIESLEQAAAKVILKKLLWYAVFLIVLAALYLLSRGTVQSELGKELIGNIVRDIPFADAAYSILKEVSDYAEEIKETAEHFAAETVLVSLCKVLFMAWITPFFDWLIDLATGVVSPSGQGPGSPAGTVKLVLKYLEIGVRLVLTIAVFNPLKDALDAFDPTMSMAVALTFFVLLFLLAGFCRAILNGTSVELGMIRSYFVDILPKLFEVFVSNSLCLLLYLFWITDPYGWRPAAVFLFLLFWFMGIQETLKKLFKKCGTALLGNQWNSSSVSVGQFVLWVVCGFSTMVLLYCLILINLGDSSADRLFALSSFPFVPAVVQNLSVKEMLLSPDSGFWSSLFVLMMVCLAVMLLIRKPLERGKGGAAFYIGIWGGVTLAAGIFVNRAMMWLLEKDTNLDTNRYNGIFGIVFFIAVVFLLLYNYQTVIAAAAVTALLLCIYQGAVSAGISLAASAGEAQGGNFSMAYAAVILAAAAAGALTYALRKKK